GRNHSGSNCKNQQHALSARGSASLANFLSHFETPDSQGDLRRRRAVAALERSTGVVWPDVVCKLPPADTQTSHLLVQGPPWNAETIDDRADLAASLHQTLFDQCPFEGFDLPRKRRQFAIAPFRRGRLA